MPKSEIRAERSGGEALPPDSIDTVSATEVVVIFENADSPRFVLLEDGAFKGFSALLPKSAFQGKLQLELSYVAVEGTSRQGLKIAGTATLVASAMFTLPDAITTSLALANPDKGLRLRFDGEDGKTWFRGDDLKTTSGRVSFSSAEWGTAAIFDDWDEPQVALAMAAGSAAAINTDTVDLRVNFSEKIAGFAAEDVLITGGKVKKVAAVGEDARRFTVTLADFSPGPVDVSVARGAAIDLAGNGSAAVESLKFIYDPTPPVGTLTAPTILAAIPSGSFRLAFNEDVSGFDAAVLKITGGVLVDFVRDGNAATFKVAATAADVVNVALKNEAVKDKAGNKAAAMAPVVIPVDLVAPTLTLSSTTPEPTSSALVSVLISFNEPVVGLGIEDLVVANGTASGFQAQSNGYAFTVTALNAGPVLIGVAAGACRDSAGNPNAAPAPLGRTYDPDQPQALIESSAPDRSALNPIPLSITFTEPVTGFDGTDLTLTNATLNEFSGAGSIYFAKVTPTADGIVSIAIAPGKSVDAAGNPSAGAATLSRIYDTLPPDVGAGLSVDNVTAVSALLHWTKATDAASLQTSLTYQIRVSTSNNIANLADAEANGAVARDFVVDSTSGAITGLTSSTFYWATVIVKDPSERKSAYPTFSFMSRDVIAPTVGTPTLNASQITGQSAVIAWAPAADDVTATRDLRYALYRSLSGPMTTAAEVKANGTLISPFLPPRTFEIDASVAELENYTYNVLVKDEGGNEAAYTPLPVTTLDDTRLALPASGAGSLGIPSQRKAIFDTVHARHWACFHVTAGVECALSADGRNWTSGGTLPGVGSSFAVAFKDIGGQAYLFLAAAKSGGVELYRGALSATDVTFDPAVTPYAPSGVGSRVLKPTVSVDGSGQVWIAAEKEVSSTVYRRWQIAAKRSTNGGTGDLSSWQAEALLGDKVDGYDDVAMVALSADDMLIAAGSKGAIAAFKWQSGSWVSAMSGSASRWRSITSNSLMNTSTYKFVVFGGELYAGGAFQNVGGDSRADGLLHWTGTEWEGVREGINLVYDLHVFNGELYVAGSFQDLDGNPNADNIIRWNGSRWAAVGNTLGNLILTLGEFQGELIAGGAFQDVEGDTNADYVAHFDGVSWRKFPGLVLAGQARDVLADGNRLYIASNAMERLGYWEAGTYTSFPWSTGNVESLAIFGGDLYLAGSFTDLDGIADADNIARWDGTTLHAVGTGTNSSINEISVGADGLYAAGIFSSAGGVASTQYIARWTGADWQSVGATPANYAYSSIQFGGQVWAGGIGYISQWNGSSWISPSTGSDSAVPSVTSVIECGGSQYVGGTFSSAGGVANTRGVARWDGTQWQSLGTGLNGGGSVQALACNGGYLYVGGTFSVVSNPTYSGIARWDGSAWSTPLSGGAPVFGVTAMVVRAANDIVIADNNGIRQWNGTIFTTLSFNSAWNIKAMAASGSTLCVGGSFTNWPPVSGAAGLICWNGTSWYRPGSIAITGGPTNVVNALSFVGTDLYVGGMFTDGAGLALGDGLLKWNGTAWSALWPSSNNSYTVTSLFYDGTDLWVAGQFSVPSYQPNLMRWNGSAFVATSIYGAMAQVPRSLATWNGKLVAGTDSANGLNITEITDAVIASGGDPIGISLTSNGVGGAWLGARASSTQYTREFDGTTWGTLTTFGNSANSPACLTRDTSTNDVAAIYLSSGLKVRWWDDSGSTWLAQAAVSDLNAAESIACPESFPGTAIPVLLDYTFLGSAGAPALMSTVLP